MHGKLNRSGNNSPSKISLRYEVLIKGKKLIMWMSRWHYCDDQFICSVGIKW
jgi:hypothetical protein